MVPGEVLIDAFLTANILFVVAFALWCLARAALSQLGLRHAHGTYLRVLNSIFLVIVLSPFLMLGLGHLQGAGFARGVDVNLSDMVVSYYLDGRFEMRATEFERLLLLRDSFTADIMHARGWLAQSVIAAFLAGLGVGLLRLAHSINCLRRIVAGSYHWRRFGKLRIRLSDRCSVPFSTRGLRYYYVVLPSHMLGQPDELKVSLAHELQHLRQGDVTWELLLETLKPLFFLNPAYHAWKRQVEHLRELSCDSEVLKRGRVGMRIYCETLLSVCQQSLSRNRMFQVATPKVTLVAADRGGQMSSLEQRITTLLEAGSFRCPKLVYGAIVVPVLAMTILTAIAIQRPGDWSQDRLMLSTVVNLERLEEINRLSTFGRLRE